MKRNADFRNALGQPDEYFRQSVLDTLNDLNREADTVRRPERRFPARLVCTFAALLLVVMGSVLTVRSGRLDPLGWFSAVTDDSITPTAVPLASPDAVDTEYATLTFRDTVADDYGVYMSLEIQPKQDNCIVLARNILPYALTPTDIGITPDHEYQSVAEWAKAHGCKLLSIDVASPKDSDTAAAGLTMEVESAHEHRIGEDGSTVISISGRAVPGASSYDLTWTITPWDLSDRICSTLDHSQEEQGTVSVPVSEAGAAVRTVETTPATVTFRDAVTDGTGVFINVDIRPRNEKILPLTMNFDPYHSSPEAIGKEPDYDGQNIYQWAKAHGYEEILNIRFSSAFFSPTSGANLRDSGNTFTLREDGTLTGIIAGGAIPEAEIYELYWQVSPYDMTVERADFVDDVMIVPLLYDRTERGTVTITVSDEKETPEFLGEYQLSDSVQEPKATVSFFRTSRSDYFEVRTRDAKIADCDSAWLSWDGIDSDAARKSGRPSINRVRTLDDGTTSILCSWFAPETFPDAMTITMNPVIHSASEPFEPFQHGLVKVK